MERRTVLQFSLAGAAGAAGAVGSLFVPSNVLAAGVSDAIAAPMAGGVYYTKDRPGRWAKKVSSHLPMIERVGGKINVTTRHPQDGFTHYIVKHTILDANFQYVAETSFDPTKDKPVSSHDVSKLRDVVYVASMCNVHDVWLNALKL